MSICIFLAAFEKLQYYRTAMLTRDGDIGILSFRPSVTLLVTDI